MSQVLRVLGLSPQKSESQNKLKPSSSNSNLRGKSTVLEKDWLREFAGYLHRRSRSRKKIWLRRYFVFKNDVLRYFVDSRELEFHWEAKVETITKVFRNSEGYGKWPFTITIQVKDAVLELGSKDKDDMDMWISFLNRVINSEWHKNMTSAIGQHKLKTSNSAINLAMMTHGNKLNHSTPNLIDTHLLELPLSTTKASSSMGSLGLQTSVDSLSLRAKRSSYFVSFSAKANPKDKEKSPNILGDVLTGPLHLTKPPPPPQTFPTFERKRHIMDNSALTLIPSASTTTLKPRCASSKPNLSRNDDINDNGEIDSEKETDDGHVPLERTLVKIEELMRSLWLENEPLGTPPSKTFSVSLYSDLILQSVLSSPIESEAASRAKGFVYDIDIIETVFSSLIPRVENAKKYPGKEQVRTELRDSITELIFRITKLTRRLLTESVASLSVERSQQELCGRAALEIGRCALDVGAIASSYFDNCKDSPPSLLRIAMTDLEAKLMVLGRQMKQIRSYFA